MAAKVLTKAGADVVMLEAGADVGRGQGLEDVALALRVAAARRGDAGASRSASSTAASAAGTSRASRTRSAAATKFDWFRAPHARRAHQSLGPHLAALRARRLQAAAASTASATTGRSATTTSSRTTTSSIAWSASSASMEGLRNEPDGIFLPPPKPRCYELLIKQAADKLKHHLHSRRGCRSSPSRSTAGRPATTAASAAAAARRTRTSRQPRRAAAAGAGDRQAARSSPTRWRARC